MFGIDEIYEELLTEAKSPEEIKKILQYQFVDGKGVPQEIFEKILNEDPTKKKTFTKWVLMQWEKEHTNIISALKEGRLSDMFKYYQERANTGLNLLNMKSFTEALNAVPSSKIDPIFNIKPEEKELPENNFNIVYDSPEWRIAIPKTVEASEKLGRGCIWCTAGAYGNAEHYFNNYNRKGNLWVNFDKRKSEIGPDDKIEYPYTRYQFCFESGDNGELQDSHNDRIDFTKINMPEDVLEFYRGENEFYYDLLIHASDEDYGREALNLRRLQQSILTKEVDGHKLYLIPSTEDPDYYQFYREEDLTDSIDSIFYTQDNIIDSCDGFNLIIMSTTNMYGDETYAVYFLNNWRGNNIIWESISGAKIIVNNNECKIFEYSNCIYNIYGNTTADFGKLNHFNDNISEINEVNLPGCPPEVKNYYWLQIEYSNGNYCLTYVDPVKKMSGYVIYEEIPLNGKYFTVTEENGEYYIYCKFNKYKLYGGEPVSYFSDKHSLRIVNVLENNNDYAVVDIIENPYFNVCRALYDIKNREVIYNGEVESVFEETGSCVFVDFPLKGYTVCYDYENRNILCKAQYTSAFKSLTTYYYIYEYISFDDNKHYIINTEKKEVYGPYDDVEKVIGDEKAVVIISNERKTVSLTHDEKNDFLKDGEFVKEINKDYFIFNKNNTLYLYDSLRNELVSELKTESSYFLLQSKYVVNRPLVFIKPNDKENIIAPRYGVILPEDADSVLTIKNQGDNTFGYVKDNKVYFVFINSNGSKKLPSKNGIPKENYFGSLNVEDNNSIYEKLLIGVILNGVKYKVLFNPFNNVIEDILTNSDNIKPDNNIIRQIEKMFFPQKVQISEQFKNIINRINNL